ncbi:MAG: lasso peptide biosynthesis B2 protein [Leptolyngbyaceae cyanobacterium MO_188.B28]|nr:lasso peptide biosynthesis B2 protein [Leptolyngbyaceae cyanobacterium MO_188.B28]
MFRKVKTLIRQPLFIQFWLAPTWLLLGFSRAIILILSFKRLVSSWGVHNSLPPTIPLLESAEEVRALHIGRVVRLSARYTPWGSNCFTQAVTARLLLGLYRIPYALYFGLARDSSTCELTAHAWVAAGRVRVTGGYGFGQFTVVGCFVFQPPHSELSKCC